MVTSDIEKAFENLVPECNGYRVPHSLFPSTADWIDCRNCGKSRSHLELLEEVRRLKAAIAAIPGRMWDGRHKFGMGSHCEYCTAKMGTLESLSKCAANMPAQSMSGGTVYRGGGATAGVPFNYNGALAEEGRRIMTVPLKQVDCTCPTLLNGHHNGCPMRR